MISALKLAVLNSGMKQWRVAQLAQISQTKLSHYENGRIKHCPADERQRLAKVLNRKVEELFPEIKKGE
jgi:Helix-turn-helix.